MKAIDLFCASPASTAIYSSVDQRATPRDRHIGDKRRTKPHIPCSSQLPFDPKPYYHNSRKNNSAKQSDVRRKSSADISDLKSPHGSARYLLSDKPFMDFLSDSEHHLHVSALVASQSVRSQLVSSNAPSPLKSASTNSRPRNQVVELRVSIHCKGCEGKVRKHISRMEGVRSFSIDLATKKVTIVGDVTPLGVLNSVSRVKNAQFWPSPTTSSFSSSPMVVGRS